MSFTIDSDRRVEVSGWDKLQNFFVEKATIEWGNGATKTLRIRAALQEGSVIFLRALPSIDAGRPFPTAFQVVGMTSTDGPATLVHVAQLHPRPSFAKTPHDEMLGPAYLA
jgi:hypothetical protein